MNASDPEDPGSGVPGGGSLGAAYLMALLALVGSVPSGLVFGQEGAQEGDLAIRKLRTAPGLKVELFAADPLFVNPVSFAIDDRGRVYMAETHRRFTSVYEVDAHPDWLEEDLAARTVADREAIYRRHLGEKAESLTVQSERIRVLEDRSGTGRADRAVTFAEGFRGLTEGLGSSILVRGSDVWYTCVPNLWRLRDSSGTGEHAERTLLHTGFGVHISSGAHDLHGLAFGPDGKIYFSMGDRGLHVESGGTVLDCPDAGAVLRVNPDGSDLELYATGLRNPEHLAFDRYGNLFTGDNNSDYGDQVRWLYVVEGGEYGWRYGYQHLVQKSPWMQERLWDLDAGRTAPYLLPPAGHLGHGPSGVAYAPGTGLPAEYDDHFFMCDFPGGVHALSVKPKGAGFELAGSSRFLWELWPTDVHVGPDGSVYVSDWVQGWPMPEKGRLYRVFDPALRNDPAVLETRRLLSEGMGGRALPELGDLLGHRDQRVRQAAQEELVGRRAADLLTEVARRPGAPQMARIHALWGLVELGSAAPLVAAVADPDPEIRSQAAKGLGDLRPPSAAVPLVGLLEDPAPRPRFFAAIALGKYRAKEAFAALVRMIRENDDADPFLRHAGVQGLLGVADAAGLIGLQHDPSRAVRLAALLALRRLGSAQTARFLEDPDPGIVLEAARAIHDVPIPGAFEALAGLLGRASCPAPALRRAINAAGRRGGRRQADALAEFALRGDAPEPARVQALEVLARWGAPPDVDPVMGLWRPVGHRDPAEARQALALRMGVLLEDRSAVVRLQAVRLSGMLGVEGTAEKLLACVSKDPVSSVRVEALGALGVLRASALPEALSLALADPDPALRREAIRLLPDSGRADAALVLARVAREPGPLPLRQSAILGLGRIPGGESAAAIEGFLDQLLAGGWPAPVALDLLEAAAARPEAGIRERLARHDAARAKEDPLAPYRESLEGGDAESGRKIFFERTQVSCTRCHTIRNRGGEVGPPLTTVGAQKTRDYLLESILLPNKVIAQGYGQEVVATLEGSVEVGRIEKETEAELVLVQADGSRRKIPKKEIRARKAGMSAMPEGLGQYLSKRDLRDLVEFLAGLKE